MGSVVAVVVSYLWLTTDKTAQVSLFLVYFNRHPQILSAVDYHGAGCVEHRHENCETTCHYLWGTGYLLLPSPLLQPVYQCCALRPPTTENALGCDIPASQIRHLEPQ